MTESTRTSPSDFDGLHFIGETTTLWVNIEFYVKNLIGMLATLDPEMGQTLTWDQPWYWLKGHLSALVVRKATADEKARTLVHEALEALDKLDARRNSLAHPFMELLRDEKGSPQLYTHQTVGLKAVPSPVGKKAGRDIIPIIQTVWTPKQVAGVKAIYAKAIDQLDALGRHLVDYQYLYKEWPRYYLPPLYEWP